MFRPVPLVALLLIAASCLAGPADWTETILDNGLRVRLMPNPGSGLVASNVFVGAGSTREEDRYAGSSHFLEHLLFNGTERRTQEELYAEVDRIGGYNNATTREEYTHYMMVAPSEHLDTTLDIQSDMLLHSILPPDKFEKERGIVIEEISKDRDNPAYRAQRTLDVLTYGETSPFARPVLGTPETIAALPREAVLEYYRRQYVPSNMLVVLMGEFDPDAALDILERTFAAESGSALPAPDLTWPDTSRLRAAPTDADQTTLQVLVPVVAPGHEDYPALTVLTSVLGEGETSRLHTRLNVEPRIETASASAGLMHRQGQTLLSMQVTLDDGTKAEEALRRMLGALASLNEGFTREEWSTARTRLLGESIAQVEQLHYYALLQGDRIWHAPAGFEPSLQKAIGEAGPRLVKVARRYFEAPALRVCWAGPEVDPRDETLEAAAFGYVPSGRIQAEPLAGDGRQTSDVPKVTAVVPPSSTLLANGMTLLHAASPTTRMFALHLLVRDRSAREPAGKEGIADLLHRLLPNGAGPYGRDELQQRLAAIGADLKVTDNPWIPFDDYYTTPLYSYVRLECVDENFAAAIELLGLMITQPHVEEKEVDAARREMQGVLQRQSDRAADVGHDRFAQLLYPDHPLARAVMGTQESLEAIRADDVRAFAATYFDPRQLILAVVGNIPLDVAREHVTRAFALQPLEAALPTTGALPLTAHDLQSETTVGGAQSSVRVGRVVQVAPEDRWALTVAVRVASSEMQQDLRETRGLAYSLGIGSSFWDGRAAITASIATRPENVDEVLAELQRYLRRGAFEVDAGQIEAAVNGYLGRMRMRRVTRIGQAYRLCADVAQGEGLEHARLEAEGMRQVTADDVRRVAERYLAEGPVVTFVAR